MLIALYEHSIGGMAFKYYETPSSELENVYDCAVIYLERERNQGISPGLASPLKFSNYHNNTCNYYQKSNLFSLMVSEATRSSLRGYKFQLGEHAPRHPSLSMLPHTIISPSIKKSGIKPCCAHTLHHKNLFCHNTSTLIL